MTLGGLIEDLIRSNRLKYTEGHLEILDIPGIVLPAPTYVILLEEIASSTDVEVLDLLFEAGLKHGKIAVNDVGRKNKTSPRQFVEQVINTANVMGMGKIEVERYDHDKGILVTSIDNSPINTFIEKSSVLDYDRPIHHFWRGAIHSMSEEIFDSEIESEEKQCEYLGDDKCLIRCEAK